MPPARRPARGRRVPTDVLAFLRDRDVFGDLVDNEKFTTEYARVLTSLHNQGAEATLDMLLAEL